MEITLTLDRLAMVLLRNYIFLYTLSFGPLPQTNSGFADRIVPVVVNRNQIVTAARRSSRAHWAELERLNFVLMVH